ncbi:hypothetical protein FJZ36_06050 [Candidatus Poribacteria bacterium]|nr:hypothetical protein [Candidatus Poribacteria bacterium]
MLRQIAVALEEYDGLPVPIQGRLLNDLTADCAAAMGIGEIAVIGDRKIIANVRGSLRETGRGIVGVSFGPHTIRIDFEQLRVADDGYEQLRQLLAHFDMDGDGSYIWFVPDGYMASLSEVEKVWEKHGGGYFSHESICVLNTASRPTDCILEAFYEDTSLKPVSARFTVQPKQSVHYRLDKLTAADGSPLIRKDAPTSYKLTSLHTRVIVQASRILTSGRSSEFGSFGTTMAWTPGG